MKIEYGGSEECWTAYVYCFRDTARSYIMVERCCGGKYQYEPRQAVVSFFPQCEFERLHEKDARAVARGLVKAAEIAHDFNEGKPPSWLAEERKG